MLPRDGKSRRDQGCVRRVEIQVDANSTSSSRGSGTWERSPQTASWRIPAGLRELAGVGRSSRSQF